MELWGLFNKIDSILFFQPHPQLVDLIQSAKEPNLVFDTVVLPMLTPPVPWSSAKYGGYMLSESKYRVFQKCLVFFSLTLNW